VGTIVTDAEGDSGKLIAPILDAAKDLGEHGARLEEHGTDLVSHGVRLDSLETDLRDTKERLTGLVSSVIEAPGGASAEALGAVAAISQELSTRIASLEETIAGLANKSEDVVAPPTPRDDEEPKKKSGFFHPFFHRFI